MKIHTDFRSSETKEGQLGHSLRRATNVIKTAHRAIPLIHRNNDMVTPARQVRRPIRLDDREPFCSLLLAIIFTVSLDDWWSNVELLCRGNVMLSFTFREILYQPFLTVGKVFFLILGQDTRNFRILKITMSQRFEFRFLLRDLGIFFVPLSWKPANSIFGLHSMTYLVHNNWVHNVHENITRFLEAENECILM